MAIGYFAGVFTMKASYPGQDQRQHRLSRLKFVEGERKDVNEEHDEWHEEEEHEEQCKNGSWVGQRFRLQTDPRLC